MAYSNIAVISLLVFAVFSHVFALFSRVFMNFSRESGLLLRNFGLLLRESRVLEREFSTVSSVLASCLISSKGAYLRIDLPNGQLVSN